MPVPEALLRRGAPRNYLSLPLVEILRRPSPTHPRIDSWYSQHLAISKNLICSASSVLKHSISAIVIDNPSYYNLIPLPTVLKGPDDRDVTWPVFVLFCEWLTEGKVVTLYENKGDEVEDYGHHILWEFGRVYGCPVYQNAVLHDLARVSALSTEENPLPKITPKELEWLWNRNSPVSSEYESTVGEARLLNPPTSLFLFDFFLCLIVGDPKRRPLWEEIIFYGGTVAVEFASQSIWCELCKRTDDGKTYNLLAKREPKEFEVDERPMISPLPGVTYAMAARKALEPKPDSTEKSTTASSSNQKSKPSQGIPHISNAAEVKLSIVKNPAISTFQESEVGESEHAETDELNSAVGTISRGDSLAEEEYVFVYTSDSESDSEWSKKL